MKVLLFIVMLVFIVATSILAALTTFFLGLYPHAPNWHLPYLVITQAIPILVYLIASLLLAIQWLGKTPKKFLVWVVASAVMVYLASYYVI